MTGKESQDHGYRFATSHLDLIETMNGRDAACCTAQGMAHAARDLLVKHLGEREAYNWLSYVADCTLTKVLPK